MKTQLVLSLFPGADLFGRAFESKGMCVVRGPELLLGQDVRDFHAPPGRFDGIIGGPPCQAHSTCTNGNPSQAPDLISEFARIVQEAKPTWFIMENVEQAKHSPQLPPEWEYRKVRDYDCGGKTKRTRLFWLGPLSLARSIQKPKKIPGQAEPTLLASDGRRGRSPNGYFKDKGHAGCGILTAGRLQGYPEVAAQFMDGGKPRRFMTKEFGVHLLGNGVPRALGEWVAEEVARWLENA